MASPNPYASPPLASAPFAALHLYPLDDSFVPKRIALGGGQRVKIARPPSTKTASNEHNGFFDSRVLSRQHAEVWEDGGKIFIRDVKSSNGTFINGERLSAEGRESEPFELKSDDILEFGVDIVSEDNTTVLHRKVVARVQCVFGNKPVPGPGAGAGAGANQGTLFNNGQRRGAIPMIHQGLGGMGGSTRVPGRGLTLDHILSRLQAELAKSRDTGHDLHALTGTLNGVEETLNGGPAAATAPAFPDVLPPVRPVPPPKALSVPSLPTQAPPTSEAPAPDVIAELQAQLREQQEAFAVHAESLRALQTVLAEQETMKAEVQALRDYVAADRERNFDDNDEDEDDDDDSDAQSIVTVGPDQDLDTLEEVEEPENEDAEPSGNDFHGRSQTPEPTMEEEDESEVPPQQEQEPEPIKPPGPSIADLTTRLDQLAAQLETALATSSALEAAHAAAQLTIAKLEAKLERLEALPAEPLPIPEPVPPAPVVMPHPDIDELHAELAAVRADLAAERGQRDAWTGGLDERVRLMILAAGKVTQINGEVDGNGWRSLPSPTSSPTHSPRRYKRDSVHSLPDAQFEPPSKQSDTAHELAKKQPKALSRTDFSTAFGVLILGLAAAAVLWRVKPE
ncbi:unnamed protein product [Mycena citricolor]|uniref:FHA domain-containing protein n=1 Tax=Mycena citricolor TaxID=2018698 RepID=A0AAD2GTM2_9AGAR|nr:unnamed protein product [Mycena citricolor]CAK5263216.1 unnamed protein product [Mycena citricolor]